MHTLLHLVLEIKEYVVWKIRILCNFSKSPLKWVFSLKVRSLAKENKIKNPTFHSSENHPAFEDTTASPSSQGFLMHKCPSPLTAGADKGKLLYKSTALLLEVGSISRGDANPVHVESLSGTRKCDPNRPETLFPPAGESASGLECPVISTVTWLRWLGTVKRSQVPTEGLCPAQEEKLLARSYVWGIQQMVQGNMLTEDDFHQSLKPETIKKKTGKKSITKQFISKSSGTDFLFFFLKSCWVTKIRVYVFGSAWL